MALIISLVKDPQKSILKEGVFYIEDLVIKKRVNKIIQKGFLFKTKEGLDFYKLNALNNKVSKEIIYTKAISN